jgi:DNA mismatch repair protein MutS2
VIIVHEELPLRHAALGDIGVAFRTRDTAPPDDDGEAAPVTRSSQRRGEATGAGDQQESQDTGAVLRLTAAGGGLDWHAVRALVARDTHTPMGRERAGALEPLAGLDAVQAALADTTHARLATGAVGPPPWNVVPDVRPTLEHARTPGAVADGAELAGMIPFLEAVGRLRGYGRSLAPVTPELSAELTRLPPVTELRDRLARALEDDGTLRDDASPVLARLRRRIRDLRRDIVRRLEGYFQGAAAAEIFHERYVTVRNGRYVLPVAASAKGRFRGIVHDRSQSGATLFVEPEAMVDANNELVQSTREEEGEVLRVLAELTDAVREVLPDLDALVDALARLDVVFARAALADRMDAVAPAVTHERVVDVAGARHPLLLAQSWETPGRDVVPMDLFLDAERPLLVITGPNAGGKTVALKTLGLFALMAQSGCHVPAAPGARLPLFSGVYAIVGDDQSVAENLSTFSAFVRQLREVLDRLDDRALVLLDELGAGTDPDDGAALAQAVLEEVARRGALCVASTHLEPLKGFAATYPGARNASVEFDGERLEPTFRLVYDRPGQSYALAIGARLGLPAALIERARGYRSTQAAALQELIARLDARDRRDAERTLLLDRREAETASLLERARAEHEAARTEARERLARARADAERRLTEIRRVVNDEWDLLRRGEKSREALERSRRRLGDARRLLGDPEAGAAPDPMSAEAAPGDRVQVAHLGLEGEVLSVDGASATVRAGTVTVRVPRQALRVTHPGGAGAPARPRAAADRIQVPTRGSVSAELHIIGRTTDEARDVVEKYLDDAFLAGLATVRIVHGKGTGALRRAVHELLSAHPHVIEHRAGEPREGGDGATVATLRVG